MGTPHITYISWAESCSRSDHTARELGGRSYMVYLSRLGSRRSTVILKYIGQWVRTARILREERPDVVFVMTPPVFAAFPAFWYAWLHNKRVVLDAHSAAFLHPRWRCWQWLQRILCRRAVTTLVHNREIATLVEASGGQHTLVPDVPVIYDAPEPFRRGEQITVAVICSFNYDEPIEAITEAARQVPEATFHLTGDPGHLFPELISRLPANVALTGFLSNAAYGGLLRDADAVLTLTTRDHTMLRGAYEAIYQGTPVIISDWPVLRAAFPEGAIHVDNSPVAIARAVRAVAADLDTFRAGAARLRQHKLERWVATKSAIRAAVESTTTPTASMAADR